MARSGRLTLQAGAGPILPLASRFAMRPEGFFAFSILPDRDMPDVAAAAAVTLRAEFGFTSRAPIVSERTVAGSTLALGDTEHTVAGQTVTLRTILNAPVDLSIESDPAPVALQGIVLRAHDPAQPVPDVLVAVGSVNTVTDAQGRFFLTQLPLLAEAVVEVTDGGTTTEHALHIDYERPVNSVTLSLPD
jgi:hypothetical protein